MSIHDKDLLTGRTKLETAIERIRAYCGGKKVLVAFSGGKDSQCCYHLCEDAGIPFEAQYSVTRFEPPELIQFIRANYPEVTFRRAYTRSLVDEIRISGLPTRLARWCCRCKHKATPGFDIAVIGIRAKESAKRAKNWRMFGQKQDRTYYVCPIIDWSNEDVWEYLNGKGVKHCKLYDDGFTRIGCVCCPLVPTKMESDAKRWPKIANMLYLGHLQAWKMREERGMVTRNGKPYRMFECGSPEESFRLWLKSGQTFPDANTQDEPCLFAGSGFSESDGAT